MLWLGMLQTLARPNLKLTNKITKAGPTYIEQSFRTRPIRSDRRSLQGHASTYEIISTMSLYTSPSVNRW